MKVEHPQYSNWCNQIVAAILHNSLYKLTAEKVSFLFFARLIKGHHHNKNGGAQVGIEFFYVIEDSTILLNVMGVVRGCPPKPH